MSNSPTNRNSSSDETDTIGIAESSKELLPKLHNKSEEEWSLNKSPPNSSTQSSTEDNTSTNMTSYRKESDVIINNDVILSDRRKYAAVFVLFLINLLNYMDRFTIAGVLIQIQTYFDVDNGQAGLLQTIFLISYMITAPLFGYLGDRYNRKIILFFGISFWIGSTLAASFINDGEMFWLFMLFRALVGIGEASYSTIAPTIISDLFVGNKRTFMLGLFFFANPVGSGLGYVAGSGMEKIFGSWHWALRITPVIGVLVVILMLIILPNIPRGAADTVNNINRVDNEDNRAEGFKGYLEDLSYIAKNKTYWLVTAGLTFMAFMAGSISFWGPKYVAYALIVADKLTPCTGSACEYSSIAFKFGVILCCSGIGGVMIGLFAAKKYGKIRNDSDALICATGLLLSGPFLLGGFELATIETNLAWLMIFFANLTVCFTWTPCADMTLYITMPNRRSTANSLQILIMHLFGDAGSPYLIGVISDYLQHGKADTYVTKFLALKYAFYMTPFAVVIGGSMFLFSSLFVGKDRKKVQDALKGKTPSNGSSSNSSDIELASTAQLLKNNVE